MFKVLVSLLLLITAWWLGAYAAVQAMAQLGPRLLGLAFGDRVGELLMTYEAHEVQWQFQNLAIWIAGAVSLCVAGALWFRGHVTASVVRQLSWPVALFASLAVIITVPRILAVACLPIVFYIHGRYAFRGTRLRNVTAAYALFLVLCISPAEVSAIDYPGPPRFVPVEYGLPGREMIDKAERGEVFLGGCVPDPMLQWLWVW